MVNWLATVALYTNVCSGPTMASSSSIVAENLTGDSFQTWGRNG